MKNQNDTQREEKIFFNFQKTFFTYKSKEDENIPNNYGVAVRYYVILSDEKTQNNNQRKNLYITEKRFQLQK